MKTAKAKVRTTIFFDPAVIKQAKAQAVVEETTLTVLIEKALLKYLPPETVIKKPGIKHSIETGS